MKNEMDLGGLVWGSAREVWSLGFANLGMRYVYLVAVAMNEFTRGRSHE